MPRMAAIRWILLPLLLMACGCGGKDYKQIGDKMVTEAFDQHGPRVEAIPFFEKGGRYYDKEDDTRPNFVDREILLPMLKKLQETYRTDQWVIPTKDDPNMAMYVLVALPANKNAEDALAKVVEEYDQKFDGLILQQWGHEWLSIDFMSKESLEFFKKSDPDIEKQR